MMHQAVLLLGPTGSGKTPLGELCEQRGLWGRQCAHFDFGENLRCIAEQGEPRPPLEVEDLGIVLNSLATGALLEDNQFYIAERILLGFIQEKHVGQDDLVLMNGLPRHKGQAEALEAFIEVVAVVRSECPAEVVYERIRRNTGGDRSGRPDDSRSAIADKLEIFRRRTSPLVAYYEKKGAQLIDIVVDMNTTAGEMYREIAEFGTRNVE